MQTLQDPTVVSCLLPHLTISDVFRMRRAFGHAWTDVWLPMNSHALCARLRLKQHRSTSLSVVSKRMTSTVRCRECGVACYRKIRVCTTCARNPQSFLSLMTRRDIAAHFSEGRPKGFARRVRELPLATIGRSNTYYYWRHVVVAEFHSDRHRWHSDTYERNE